MSSDCIDYKKDDPRAFSYLWEINRLIDKLSAHIDGDHHEAYDKIREGLYFISISIEERLMKPIEYDKGVRLLNFYRSRRTDLHPYRRFY